MAQKGDILKTTVGITVAIVIVIGLYYLLKKLFTGLHWPGSGIGIGGNGGPNVTGVPGANINTGGNPSSVANRVFAGTNLPDLSVPAGGYSTSDEMDKVTNMAKNAVGKTFGKVTKSVKDVLDGGLVKELSKANKEAHQYRNKPGTTIRISATLNAINALPDHDFIRVVTEWKKKDGIRDFYNSDIAAAMLGFSNLNKGAQSRFLTRARQLGVAS